MTKTWQDNYFTHCKGVVYAEIGIELSWPIEHIIVYQEKQTE